MIKSVSILNNSVYTELFFIKGIKCCGDYMMIIKIRKLQCLCGLCLLLQLLCFKWIVPFHIFAVVLSFIIIMNHRKYKAIQIQYHYYVIALYFYKLWLISVGSLLFFELVYCVLCIYISMVLILFSFYCLF